MAINTTGNNGSVVGVTGVHPDNMSDKSFNFENNKYEVRLSKGTGNMLEQRDDGLYYGTTPTVWAYWVSNSTGNDSNVGTKEAPFRTLKAAFSKIKPNQRTTIFLDENDTHEWRSSFGRLADNVTFSILPYGSVSDYVDNEKRAFSAYGVRSAEQKRPTLKLIADRLDNGFIDASLQDASTNMNEINGVKLVLQAPPSNQLVPSTQFFGTGGMSVNMWLRGCEITPNADVPLFRVGSAMNIVFDHCKLTNTTDKLIHIEPNGLLQLGFRFVYDTETTKGTPIGGNKVDGTPSTLTFNGANPKSDFWQVLSGKTTAQKVGILY